MWVQECRSGATPLGQQLLCDGRVEVAAHRLAVKAQVTVDLGDGQVATRSLVDLVMTRPGPGGTRALPDVAGVGSSRRGAGSCRGSRRPLR